MELQNGLQITFFDLIVSKIVSRFDDRFNTRSNPYSKESQTCNISETGSSKQTFYLHSSSLKQACKACSIDEKIKQSAQCNSSEPKECIEVEFSCQIYDEFMCLGGNFRCGSNELFECKTGSAENAQFTCRYWPDEAGFDCPAEERESFKCDGSIFGCYNTPLPLVQPDPFNCIAGDQFDFDCTNRITFDFNCGSSNEGYGHFNCTSNVTDGFFCDANHVFLCGHDFECSETHTCSPTGGKCEGNWGPPPPDDGFPSDFRCGNDFSCGNSTKSTTGEFNCTAMSEFICGSVGYVNMEFTCHNKFTCKPTDGEGYEGNGEAFVCTDGAFDCGTEGFNCTGDTDKFRCADGFDCSQGFDCSTFDCYDEFDCDPPFNCLIEYRCRPMFCPVPSQDPFEQPPEAFDCSETFTCTAHFKCVNSVQFGGCHPTPANFACNSIAFNPPS